MKCDLFRTLRWTLFVQDADHNGSVSVKEFVKVFAKGTNSSASDDEMEEGVNRTSSVRCGERMYTFDLLLSTCGEHGTLRHT